MRRKFSPAPFPPTTDRSSLPAQTLASDYGTPEERTNSPAKIATIKIGSPASGTPPLSKTRRLATPLTSVQSAGMEESKFGTPISKSDALSNIMTKTSTVSASPPTANTSPPQEEEKSLESGTSPK